LDILLLKISNKAITNENENKDSMGMVIQPKILIYSSVQETPWLQGCMLSGMIPE